MAPKLKVRDKAYMVNGHKSFNTNDVFSIVHIRCTNPRCCWPCNHANSRMGLEEYYYVIRFPNGDCDYYYNDTELIKVTPMSKAIYGG